MRSEQISRGVIIYEKDEEDLRQEAVARLAALQAQALDDTQAAQVSSLFPVWAAGVGYAAGARVSDGAGRLYKVVQAHTSQADWPMASTTTLYTPLGVTVGDPEAVPKWAQPTGAQDAYQKGDRVQYQGKVWESLLNGNVWAPDAYPAGWARAEG